MKIITLSAFSLATFFIAPAVAAPAWDAMERRCVGALEAECTKIHGANCLGWWPSAVHCVLSNLQWSRPIEPYRVDRCIDAVQQRRSALHLCAMCGTDPIADAIRCVTGE